MDEKLTYSVEDVALLIGVSRNSAYLAVKNGTIPSIKIGGRRLVPREALHRLLGSAKTEPAQSARQGDSA